MRSALTIASATLLLAGPSIGAAAVPVDFNRDIRPILSDACYHCHGPDEAQRKAKLRLDTKDGAFRLRDGKAIIVPGTSAASELFLRIAAVESSERMPPARAPRQLTPAQIDLVRCWIDEGARWDTHWSFAPAQRPTPPTVANPAWPRNPIDRFIHTRD